MYQTELNLKPLNKAFQVKSGLSPVEINVAPQIMHSNVADIVCSLCALRERTRLGAGSSVPVFVGQWKFFGGLARRGRAEDKTTNSKCK